MSDVSPLFSAKPLQSEVVTRNRRFDAYLLGRNGGNVRTETTEELAAWFAGIADHCKAALGR
jgi:hypothetical protein